MPGLELHVDQRPLIKVRTELTQAELTPAEQCAAYSQKLPRYRASMEREGVQRRQTISVVDELSSVAREKAIEVKESRGWALIGNRWEHQP